MSAGSVGSPHLLMVSGIGDRSHLEGVGVSVVHHLPEVGANLQDHLMVPLNMDVKDGLALDPLLPLSAFAEYREGRGPMATTRIPVIGTGSLHRLGVE